ncbi:MAG: polyribonucleotide nucleotidyltransferase [Deltaproteobacteria bacterium]|nr:polyribonucleotide nucleotidyltransferase [Deltaproteobacteria bacterium]MBW2084517.1 polyribonucleotide nucleotidyltransferase [Deltaproteobacteria bacterium]
MKLEKQFGEATLIIEADHVARQASGAVMVRCEDTIVLVTVVSTRDQRTGIDFLPLTVEYQERYYSVGRIPGNFFRREVGRPSEKETLIARLIDRPCRPLFPEGWNYETQIIATVLSVDEDYDADMLALIGASAALEISDIPFQGPIAGTRVVRVDGELVTNPVQSQIEKSDLNIIVAGSREAVVMVEGEAIEVEEEVLLEAVFLAQKEIQPILDMQEELKAALGKPKRQPPPFEQDEAFATMVKDQYRAEAKEALLTPAKQERHEKSRLLRERAVEELSENYPDAAEKISLPFEELERDILRDLILKEEKRIDGRSVKEVRPINCQVAVLPRAHGSAIFTRGETQALGIATLGTSHDDQRLDALIGETSKSFMLHYNFPPYCVGEARRLGPPKRRDVGHGALAERALKSVLPDQEEFPYTIRVVSEILESNGSSSMATVCAGTMALMDAGVPIRSPIAGVAMGLVVENGEVVILTDIIGDEDHLGDMDLKIAGSRKGVTGIQMDIKVKGISKEILEKALSQAREGRMHILDEMEKVIAKPRPELSEYAPKTTIIEINPDKIRDLIGPQGKVIRAIQSETDTRIDVEDTGKVIIYARNAQSADTAIKQIKEVTQEAEVDQIYKGKVVKIMDFGAFVEILPGTDGLVHISQLAPERVKAVTDVVKEGDEILVKVLDIDKQGKIRLSRKAVLEEAAGKRH